MAGPNRGQSTLEQALVLAAVITGLLGAHFYARRAYMGRIYNLGQTFGDSYVPRATTRDQTLTLKLEETITGSTAPIVSDPSQERLFVLTNTTQDETTLTGTETVRDNAGKRLLDY